MHMGVTKKEGGPMGLRSDDTPGRVGTGCFMTTCELQSLPRMWTRKGCVHSGSWREGGPTRSSAQWSG